MDMGLIPFPGASAMDIRSEHETQTQQDYHKDKRKQRHEHRHDTYGDITILVVDATGIEQSYNRAVVRKGVKTAAGRDATRCIMPALTPISR